MTTIILSKEGIEALFPEGSEARVELQRTVLAQLAKQAVKTPGFNASLMKEINNVQKQMSQEILAEMGIVVDERYRLERPTISDKMRETIASEARIAVRGQIHEAFDAERVSIDEKVGRLMETCIKHATDKAAKEAAPVILAIGMMNAMKSAPTPAG
jgi:hypothetical protein